MVPRIIVDGLGKRFRRYHPERPNTFTELLLSGLRRWRPEEEFWALREVSFQISAGRMVGVIGANGAGKSTLLSLIGGVGRADEGRVTTHGRFGALLDLGAGFHPDLTGRENLYISGVISGLTRQEVADRFDEIVAFAELEAFIDNPLRTYSTGMQMRLAFAVAIHIEPEILLIDEVLAVGDIAFQQKCLDRIMQFREKGCAVLLVSHDPGLVAQLCDEAIWLQHGRIVANGPAELVVDEYKAAMDAETKRRTPASAPVLRTTGGAELRLNENRFGSLEVELTGVALLDEQGEPAVELENGRPLQIRLNYRAKSPVAAPIFGVSISREDGFVCYDTSTDMVNFAVTTLQGEGAISLHLDRLDLAGGAYFVDVGVYEGEWAYAYDYHWHAYPLLINAAGGGQGVLLPPQEWSWSESAASPRSMAP